MTRALQIAAGVLTLVISATAPTAQQFSSAASISGTVIADDASGRPMRRATVALSGATLGVDRIAITDDVGRFEFGSLAPGRYTVSASKRAYVTTYYGSRRQGRGPAAPIAVREDEHVGDITLRLAAGAVITGVARDQLGRPRQDINVTLLEIRSQAGSPIYVPAAVTRTDDVGVYRFFGLTAGRYLVAGYPFLSYVNGASVPSDEDFQAAQRGIVLPADSPALTRRPVGYSPTFHPSAIEPNRARSIDVVAGEERTDVDIAFQFLPTSRITGTVATSSGVPARTVQLALVAPWRSGSPAQPLSDSLYRAETVTVQNGTFSIGALGPGHYTLVARGAGGDIVADRTTNTPADLTHWAIAEFDLDGRDQPDVVMTLEPGMTISGRVTFDHTRATPPTNLSAVQLRLVPFAPAGVNLAVAPVSAQPDGTFSFRGVAPGRYRVSATAGAGRASSDWILTSALVAGADTLDSAIVVTPRQDVADVVVTFSDRAASISGTLVDALGAPAPEYFVVVFPADPTLRTSPSRRVRHVHPGTDGAFAMPGLPGGAYLIAAVTDLDPSDLTDAAFLDMLSATAVRISIADGESIVQHLRIAGTKGRDK